MKKNNNLFYSPPVRGKIGTLHRGRYLCFDALLILFFFLLPRAILKIFGLSLGRRLEKRLFGGRAGKRHKVLFVDSGASALLLALEMIGLKKGEEVYFSSNTCGAVCDAVSAAGGVPVFLGTRDDGSTDLDSLSRLVDAKRGKALILTNTYGLLENIEYARQQAEKFNLFVINDLAQANILSDVFPEACAQADISVLSFGPEKYIAGLGAGALVHQNSLTVRSDLSTLDQQRSLEIAKIFFSRLRYYLTFLVFGTWLHGILLSVGMVFSLREEKDIEASDLRIIEPKHANPILLAGILLRIYFMSSRAHKEAYLYDLLRANIDPEFLVGHSSAGYAPAHLIIRTPIGKRFDTAKVLAKNKFQTTWNYIPLYLLKPYRGYRHIEGSGVWERILQVPFRSLSEKRIATLTSIINHDIG